MHYVFYVYGNKRIWAGNVHTHVCECTSQSRQPFLMINCIFLTTTQPKLFLDRWWDEMMLKSCTGKKKGRSPFFSFSWHFRHLFCIAFFSFLYHIYLSCIISLSLSWWFDLCICVGGGGGRVQGKRIKYTKNKKRFSIFFFVF